MRKSHCFFQLLLLQVLYLLCCGAWAQHVYVEPAVPISFPGSGWHNWTVIEADPYDSHRLIACGDKWSASTNSLIGVLYVSSDGGKSWQLKLTDTSTPWVSEESCAFGPDGTAYFIADASRIVDGVTHHDLGQSHLYHSEDGGRNWAPPTIWQKWTDASLLSVDNTAGRHRGSVYIWYQGWKDEESKTLHVSQYPLYSGDNRNDSGGQVGQATIIGLPGLLPAASRVLSNGSVVGLFASNRGFGPAAPIVFATFIPDEKTARLPTLVQLMQVVSSPTCHSKPGMGVDNSDGTHRGTIYVLSVDSSAGGCRLLLSSTSDNGRTWSTPRPINIPGDQPSAPNSGSLMFTIGVNTKGTIGLAWTDDEYNCWRFSASADGGASFTPSEPLSRCDNRRSLRSLNNSLGAFPVDDRPDKAAEGSSVPFSVRANGYVWKISMAVTPDGLFHPVWMDSGGQIWTASVSVDRPIMRSLPSLADLQDVSSQVTFNLSPGYYDEGTGTVSIDVGFVNKTTATSGLKAPLLMQITDLYSDFGTIEVENGDNGERGVGAVWDMSSLLASQPLLPGAISERRRLLFRLSNPRLPSRRLADLVILRAKILGSRAGPQ